MTRRGEDAFTARLASAVRPSRGVRVGIGDDAAVIDLQSGHYVFTTDTLVERVDFLSGEDPKWIGRKAAASNLSDLAAMGAEPLGALLTLGLPAGRGPAFAGRLARAALSKLASFGAGLWGGDLSRSRELFVTICLIGRAKHPVTRSGARNGDLVYLTGQAGAASRGLALRKRRRTRTSRKPAGDERRYLDPEPRVKLGRMLSEKRLASSMIDVSDGLARDAHRLAAASGIALVLHGIDPVTMLLPSDDFELLFTAPRKHSDAVRRAAKRTRTPLCEIGSASSGHGVFWSDGRRRIAVADRGYDHFSR